MQVDEANSALEGLQQNRRTTEYRLRHYLQLMGEDLNKIPAEGTGIGIAGYSGYDFCRERIKIDKRRAKRNG